MGSSHLIAQKRPEYNYQRAESGHGSRRAGWRSKINTVRYLQITESLGFILNVTYCRSLPCATTVCRQGQKTSSHNSPDATFASVLQIQCHSTFGKNRTGVTSHRHVHSLLANLSIGHTVTEWRPVFSCHCFIKVENEIGIENVN